MSMTASIPTASIPTALTPLSAARPAAPRLERRDLATGGPLDAAAVLALRHAVVDAVADRAVVVLLDVSAVTRVTPSGVAGMLELLRIARSAGGDFRVHGESAVLDRAHAALRLSAVLRVYRSRADAAEGDR